MKLTHLLLIFGLLIISGSHAQNATIKGVILDENLEPVSLVDIRSNEGQGTISNENGFYLLEIPAGRKVTVVFSHLSYKDTRFSIYLREGETQEINPVLKKDLEQIGEIVISGNNNERVRGITTIDPETIRNIPGANAGVENLLKILPGVSSNNELSTQYAVRGGNYDENLVYVNGIEVYRPFLIRSGQQEGLSFVNSDLVRKVHFSAGGFQAKYGDKLSSVLDITYKRPVDFGASFDASLLGVSAAVEGTSQDGKFSALTGIRYRDNSLFVKAKQTATNFQPVFADVQTNLIYQFSEKLEMSFLGNISLNEYNYEPLTRQTNFGTLQNPMALLVYYDGQEKDSYRTYFGALKTSYVINERFTTQFIASAYNTQEQEYFDILAQYRLGQVNNQINDSSFGKVEFTQGIGGQLTHARNKLDAFIVNVEHKGTYQLNKDQLDYGIKFTHEDIKDRIREYEIIDSAGFSIRPPLPDFENLQPYEAFDAPLLPYNSIRAFNETQINRVSGFFQWSRRTQFREHEIWLNLGARSHLWQVKGRDTPTEVQQVWSPRMQLAIKPDWGKEMIFRVSGGLYHQPPFYRELRDRSGIVKPSVKAQQALHVVLGHEYSFRLWERPFKLVTESYYKDITDANPYTLENVRIRYLAENSAEAYAYGLDVRMNGEFVPGTESWLSFGYLKTEENTANRGYIARPTDQRLKFGVLFQDYVPAIPSLKMFLNLVYNTGLPGGSPSYADPYLYQSRLQDYKRADLGISYLLKDPNNPGQTDYFKYFRELSLGVEIFNIFNVQNSITNTFVRDVYSKTHYAIPNYLTPRLLNLKVGMKF